jgi:hypothetical protein
MGGAVHPAAAKAIAEAATSPWRPISTAPVDTPIHLYGRERPDGEPYATVGELDHGRRYARDYRWPETDTVAGFPMRHPELWAPFPELPK